MTNEIGFIRITVAPAEVRPDEDKSHPVVRHGGIRLASNMMPDELWCGWEGLLARLDDVDLPDVFRIAKEP